jgi:hypothetical protein
MGGKHIAVRAIKGIRIGSTVYFSGGGDAFARARPSREPMHPMP